jgi:transposase
MRPKMAIPSRWKWAVDLDTREMAVRLIENGDLSPREAAAMIGVSHVAVWKWLRPLKFDPKERRAKRVAEIWQAAELALMENSRLAAHAEG